MNFLEKKIQTNWLISFGDLLTLLLCFFLSIVVEEALILGVLGFLPGLVVGTAILTLMAKITARAPSAMPMIS